MEHVDVAIVGAGLAGLSCAYTLGKAGLDVLVVDRGDYPGSKNVTGGRLYMEPMRPYFPDIWQEAPFERHVTRERLAMLSEETSVTLELRSDAYGRQPYHSNTLLRPTFDKWLAHQATDAGAAVIPKYKVESLIRDNGKVAGIRAEGEDIGASVVVAADGALSFIAQEAGLRQKHNPENFAVGAKETIELSRKVIEDRFNLKGDEGAAQLYFGSLTKSMTGGGFLYTNRESISLGIVVGIGSLMKNPEHTETYQLLEQFKQRPEVSVLIDGGESIEYSAHAIPEGGISSMPKLYSDGILITGDAAGFALNMGMVVRGMDLAMASGAIAAETIKIAKTRNDYSASSLSVYEKMLNESFVLKDLRTFRNVWKVLSNPRLFQKYPQVIGSLLTELMHIGVEPKPKFSSTAMKQARKSFLNLSTLKDMMSLLKI